MIALSFLSRSTRIVRNFNILSRCSSNVTNLQQYASSVNLTDSCVKRLKELSIKNPNKYLRVGVEGGGCSGFQYIFNLDANSNEDDWYTCCNNSSTAHSSILVYYSVIEREGVKLLVDKESLQYLEGATVDFHTELIRSAFRILKNPKAEHGCSCGASFSLKV